MDKQNLKRLGVCILSTLYLPYITCCWLVVEKRKSQRTGCDSKQTHTTSCVQPMLKSTSVSFSTFLLGEPIIVCLVWRRVVFFETPISSKSPSVVSHRPPPCLPSSCLPPCFPPPPLHLTLLHLDRKEFIAQLRSLLH